VSKKNPVFWQGPIYAGGHLIVTRSGDLAVRIDPATGQVISDFDLGGMPAVPLVVADQTLFVLTRDGIVAAWK
jgi:outer membrane protein assembly factor BamB